MALTKAKLIELIDNGDIDVGGGGFSPNLLHNWDFTNPINQRGLTTASGAGYWLDRWTLNNPIGATYTYSNVWGLRAVTTTTPIIMRQYIENPNAYAGKTVTVSFEIYSASTTDGCTIRLWYNGITEIGAVGIFNGNTGIKSFTATIPSTELTDLSVVFYNYGGNDVRIKRIKLELGTVSTLAYDPPMDYGTELAKCQRYLTQPNYGSYGRPTSTTVARLFVPTPVTMRITPSCTFSSGYLFTSGGAKPISSITVAAAYSGSVRVDATSTGLSLNEMVTAEMELTLFSAEL